MSLTLTTIKSKDSNTSLGANRSGFSKKWISNISARRAPRMPNTVRGTSMPVSFATEIRPMFRPTDINCMALHSVFLDDYAYMSDPANNHANGVRVRDYLTGSLTPRMPKGGPYWTQPMIDLFNQWMADGYQP